MTDLFRLLFYVSIDCALLYIAWQVFLKEMIQNATNNYTTRQFIEKNCFTEENIKDQYEIYFKYNSEEMTEEKLQSCINEWQFPYNYLQEIYNMMIMANLSSNLPFMIEMKEDIERLKLKQ